MHTHPLYSHQLIHSDSLPSLLSLFLSSSHEILRGQVSTFLNNVTHASSLALELRQGLVPAVLQPLHVVLEAHRDVEKRKLERRAAARALQRAKE